jgi:hypothetical protein
MKKRFTNKLRVFLISTCILLTGYIVVKACAGGDYEDGYNSNIAPETFVDSAYTPFFYSDLFYYSINYDDAHDVRFNEANVAEWHAFLGSEMKPETIDFLLTKVGYQTIKSTYSFYLGRNMLPDSIRKYSADFHLNSPKKKAFLQYLTLAKSCENFATDNQEDYWDRKPKPKKTSLDNINAVSIQKLMQQETEPFIKERYWFQLVRYNFFNDLPNCVPAFDNNKKDFENSVMYYRSMAYAAGAYYKQKNYSKANYYYSLVFAGNDALKTVAHYSFHPQEEKDWQQTLSLCTNNKERITLWQMLGVFYADEMRSMKEIYKIAPSDASIDLLLTRLINRIEMGDKATPKAILEDYNWCRQITDENKVGNPFLWNVSTGYLAYLNNDAVTAKKYYDAAGKKMPNTALAKSQLRLMQLLNQVASLKTITATDEMALLPEFQWLYNLTDSIAPSHLRFTNAQGVIKTALAKKYAAQGDLVKSECFVTHPEFYVSEKNVNDLKAFLSNEHQNAYDVLCWNFSAKKENDLWEYQAVLATFKDDLDQAITLMRKAGGNEDSTLSGNPFNGKIVDCHDCDHAQKQKVIYSKLSFLQKMKELKDNVVAQKDIYNNALLLANGYYNITHYGNARIFYEGAVLGSYQSTPYDIDSVFKPMLTNNALATKYYRLALQSATDDEQKAKCLYMIAKCERNDWYNKTFFNSRNNDPSYGNDSKVDFITWNAFSALRKYKNTQYYKDIIQECGYFKTAMEKP